MKSGIYKITCGKRFYIGSTSDFDRRWRQHKKGLQGKRHKNRFMQNLWNKTKGHGFKFEVLIGCAPEMMLKLEQDLIDHYWGDKNFMNLNPRADRPKPRRNKKTFSFHYDDGTVLSFVGITKAQKHFGVGRTTINRWAKGKAFPEDPNLIKMVYDGVPFTKPTRGLSGQPKGTSRVAYLFIMNDATEATMTSQEACEMFGVSRQTISDWVMGRSKGFTQRNITEVRYA